MRLFSSLILILIAFCSSAQLRLPNYYADNMVLQRDEKIKIWGWSKPAEQITVQLAGKSYHSIAAVDSIWQIELPKFKAGGPYVLSVESSNQNYTLNDVYFGDVWFCSGQSNMSFRVDQAMNFDTEVRDADYPLIRHFGVPLQSAITPQKDINKSAWSKANATTIGSFSAVAWFFAKEIYKKKKVPLGLIHSSWGGTPIEAFMTEADLQDFPVAKKKIDVLSADFISRTDAHNKKLVEASGISNPKGLVNIRNAYPTMVYNAMVAPFFKYPVKGVLWYQGEANSDLPVCFDYEKQLSLMINSWRTSWEKENLPFLLVQLANYNQKVRSVSPISGWAVVQEAQLKVSQLLKNVGISITNDIGNPHDAHPVNKQDVGKRLAAVALHEVYDNKDLIANGPTFSSMEVENGKLVLRFKHIGGGLVAKGGGRILNEFSIAGTDNIYHKAIAEISGDKVIVSSESVPNPINVRYAFESNPPKVNFYNKEGFPAPPFRTDKFKN